MLDIVIKKYPDFGLKVYLMTLPAGESHDFPAAGSKGSLGAIYLQSVLLLEDGAPWLPITEHFEWRPTEAWGGWNDQDALPDEHLTLHAGDIDVRWLCVSGARVIEPHAMTDEMIVPSATPFIVASDATISFGGKERGVGVLFGPRDIATKAFGHATLLFVL